MPSIVEFATQLLEEGRIIHRDRPGPATIDDPELLTVLERAFDDHALDVAGPALKFDAPAAVAGLEVIRRASWYLVSRSEPPEEVEQAMKLTFRPRLASEHLSGDLCLRFLPLLYRRARSIAAGDTLSTSLAEILRAWPLSGVLADIDEGPADVGDLGHHPGLWMLYAERLAKAERPGWMPSSEAGRERVELVFRGLGKERSPLLRRAVVADPDDGE